MKSSWELVTCFFIGLVFESVIFLSHVQDVAHPELQSNRKPLRTRSRQWRQQEYNSFLINPWDWYAEQQAAQLSWKYRV